MITRKSKFLSAMLSVCMTFSAVPAVYAAGDARTGSSLVVSAMADALACAGEVAEALGL